MGRIASLDIAKGIFIILMTLSHIGLTYLQPVNDFNRNWFFIFKMPGFYIVSGYLMYTSIEKKNFILRKIDGIYKPSIVLILLMILIGTWMTYHHGNLQMPNWRIFYARSMEDYTIHGLHVQIIAAWFVLNLPVAFVFCKGLHWSWTTQRYFVFCIVLLGLILLHIAPYAWNIEPPFKLNQCVYAVLYLFTGYFLRRINFDLQAARNILCGGLVYVALRLATPQSALSLDLFGNVFGDFVVTFTASVAGVIGVIAICSHVPEKSYIARFLSLCSQNSLYILLLHIPIYSSIDWNLSFLFDFRENINRAWAHALTIVLCVLIAVVFKRIDKYGYFFKARPKRQAAAES